MYKISNFSGKIYLDDIEIIPDDSKKEYCDFLKWVKKNEPEFIEITDFEKEEKNLLEISKIKNEYSKKINDLVFVHMQKELFDGVPVPLEIHEQRQALREECRLLIQEINPNAVVAKSK